MYVSEEEMQAEGVPLEQSIMTPEEEAISTDPAPSTPIETKLCEVIYTSEGVFAVFTSETEAEKWAHLFPNALLSCYEGYMNALRLR